MKINIVTVLGGIGKFVFGKVIGLDSIPPEKRKAVAEAAWSKAVEAGSKIVEAAAKGTAAGLADKMNGSE